MTKRIFLLLSTALIFLFSFNGCKHEPFKAVPPSEYGGFPDAIGKIMVDRCATSGCHNAATRSAGLLLDSWEHLFEGGNNGASIVAYSSDFSPLMYFINTDSTLGPVSTPSMPDTSVPGKGPLLTRDEYLAIKNWVDAGAPDRNGNIPFASNAANRQKIYLTQQGCDLVAVIDAESKLVMRYIKVGTVDGIPESPHCIRVSPDAQYAYVCFTNGKHLQKINTATDKIESQVQLNGNTPAPSWNILFVSPDNNKVLVCDYNVGGGTVMHNASSLAFEKYFDKMDKPHGVTSGASFDTLYIGSQDGNTIYKRPANNTDVALIQKISLDGNPPVSAKYPGSPDPHEIMMVPDGSKYIVTCQGSNQIKIVDAHTNAVIKTFDVAKFPQEIAMSRKNPYAFITCSDPLGTGTFKGSVIVLNYQTNTIEKTISADNTNSFSQPHGITVDDRNDALYIASQNADGPAPHHASKCGGRNGYYQVYKSVAPWDKLSTKRYEVSVQPYSADVRFKN